MADDEDARFEFPPDEAAAWAARVDACGDDPAKWAAWIAERMREDAARPAGA